jgi:Tol biopolymer transport system component
MKRPGGSPPRAALNFVLASLVVVSALTLAVLALAVLALAACGGASTTASTSPSTAILSSSAPTESAIPLPTPTVAGTIAFDGIVKTGEGRYGEGGNGNIYVVNADGTGLKQLTDAPGWEQHPSWSPDGSKIVYVVYAEGSGDADYATVWVMNADGSGQRQLTKSSVGGVEPTWSPDGKQIAFLRVLMPDEFTLFVMNADGSGLKRVMRPAAASNPNTQGDERLPIWAPNGKLLFLRLGDVFAVNLDGSGLARLTKGGNVVNYALSPDGKRLAIQNAMSHRIEVVSAHGAGTPVALLKPVSDFITDPMVAAAWTPDGHALALATGSFGGGHGSRIYVVKADGSGLSAVPGIDNAEEPAWRP